MVFFAPQGSKKHWIYNMTYVGSKQECTWSVFHHHSFLISPYIVSISWKSRRALSHIQCQLPRAIRKKSKPAAPNSNNEASAQKKKAHSAKYTRGLGMLALLDTPFAGLYGGMPSHLRLSVPWIPRHWENIPRCKVCRTWTWEEVSKKWAWIVFVARNLVFLEVWTVFVGLWLWYVEGRSGGV